MRFGGTECWEGKEKKGEEKSGKGHRIPIIPPKPHARKYCPLYNSIFGFGRAFSSVDIFAVVQFLSIGTNEAYRNQQFDIAKQAF